MCLRYGSQTLAMLQVTLSHRRESGSESGVRVRREGQPRHAARVRVCARVSSSVVCTENRVFFFLEPGGHVPRPSRRGFQRTPCGSGLMVRQMQESTRWQEAFRGGGLGESICEGVLAISFTAVGPT